MSMFFSCQVMSDSLWPRGLQHTRLPCLSLSPGACSNSCPSSRWCHPVISSFAAPFSFSLQSFPASRSLPVSGLFPSGGQSTGASASASVLQMSIQSWFFKGWLFWSLNCKRLSGVFTGNTVWNHKIQFAAFFMVQLSHLYMTIGKTIALTIGTFVSK